MGVGAGIRGWTSVAVALGAIGAVTIITQSANAPLVIADQVPPVPFDANGYDDGFAIAQSREQGPVITGKTATRASLEAAAAAAGDPVRGTFGPQVAWPVMPIHAVLLPDGRVLAYGTRANGSQTAYYEYDVWTPSTGVHSVLPNQTATDIFCSAHVVLLNGDVELYGGDNLPADTNTQNRDVNQFRPAQNTLVRTGSMNRLRWYSTAVILPNAEVYIQGGSGGADFPERRTSTGQFQLLTGAPTGNLSSGYPKNFVAPDGLVFGLANRTMYKVNPAGNGTITTFPTQFPTDNAGGTATSVMFEPGRILQVGGGPESAASRRASIIDINGASPVVTALPDAQFGRHWGNATVMADGRVLVSGGSAVNNAATGVAYTTEIFDPASNSWTTGATATRMRLYHSVSLLLPDATVITMGGGTPGPETNLNAEIYYPPYLYNQDGTPAVRPTISSATTATDPASTISIETPDAAAISRVSLVKLGAVTHSVDMDQRFLDLDFTRSGTTLSADLPDNVNETPPGYYMIFVLNGAGVPSQAKIMRIDVEGTTPPPTTTTTTSPPTTTTSTTTTTTTTLPPTTTTSTTSTTTSTTSTTTSTSTTTTTTPPPPPPPPPPVNLVANGSFESSPTGVEGWTITAGPIARTTAYSSEGLASIKVDSTTGKDRIEQVITTTVAGRTYRLSFAQTPQPGVSSNSNRFDVFWNGSKVGHVARSGVGLTSASWQTTTFTVTATGNDQLSFRDNDRDASGSFIDDVRLLAQ